MKRLTQKEMADVLGVEQPTISKYINGKLQLSVKDAITLEEELGIPVNAWSNIKAFLSGTSLTQSSPSHQEERKDNSHQKESA